MNKTDFKNLFILIMLPCQRQTRQLNYQQTEVSVVNLLAAIFGGQKIKGFREKANETQVSNTVFSHLKSFTILG